MFYQKKEKLLDAYVSTFHCNDGIISTMAPQITTASFVYSNVVSGASQRKHQSSASLTFVREIHR